MKPARVRPMASNDVPTGRRIRGAKMFTGLRGVAGMAGIPLLCREPHASRDGCRGRFAESCALYASPEEFANVPEVWPLPEGRGEQRHRSPASLLPAGEGGAQRRMKVRPAYEPPCSDRILTPALSRRERGLAEGQASDPALLSKPTPRTTECFPSPCGRRWRAATDEGSANV